MSNQGPVFEIQGFEETIKRIDFLNSLDMNTKYLVPAFKKIGGKVRKEEKGRTPTFKGTTQKGISNSVTTNGIGSVTAKIGSKKRYYILRFFEQGAKFEKKMPPARRLVEWAKLKLGASDQNALQVAFALAKSIKEHGLRPKPIVQPTIETVHDMVIKETHKAVDKMVNKLGGNLG